MPWKRLLKEWVIYAAIMAVVFALLFRGSGSFIGIIAGLLVSAPLYLAFGHALAKFGYQRKTLAELRTPRAAPTSRGVGAATDDERPRPAPTRRTAGSTNRRPSSSRKRR